MSGADDRSAIVQEWLNAADADVRMAAGLLTLDDIEPWGIAFHAQQAIEKALKTAMVSADLTVPHTHDLSMLVRLLPSGRSISLDADALDRITDYAAASRYPADPWASTTRPTLDEARDAVRDAQETVTAIAEWLALGPTDESE